jgi:hypothetical protein
VTRIKTQEFKKEGNLVTGRTRKIQRQTPAQSIQRKINKIQKIDEIEADSNRNVQK